MRNIRGDKMDKNNIRGRISITILLFVIITIVSFLFFIILYDIPHKDKNRKLSISRLPAWFFDTFTGDITIREYNNNFDAVIALVKQLKHFHSPDIYFLRDGLKNAVTTIDSALYILFKVKESIIERYGLPKESDTKSDTKMHTIKLRSYKPLNIDNPADQ